MSVVTTIGLGDTRQEPTEDLALVEGAIDRFAGQGSDVTSMASAQRAIAANANRNADPMKVRRTSTTLIDDGSVDDKDDVADEARERARAHAPHARDRGDLVHRRAGPAQDA